MTDLSDEHSMANSRHMAVRGKGGKWAPHAVRLRVLRCAIFAESSTNFAKRIGVSVQRLNNMENGFPLSIDVANKIRAAVPGLTLDWLYHGDERAIPMEIVTRLRTEAQKPEYLHSP